MVPDWEKYIGLAYGLQNGRTSAGLRQMAIQLGGIVFVICLNVVMTSLICLLIQLAVPLRLNEDELRIGDHGEEAFDLVGENEKFDENPKRNLIHGFDNSKINRIYDMEEYSSFA